MLRASLVVLNLILLQRWCQHCRNQLMEWLPLLRCRGCASLGPCVSQIDFLHKCMHAHNYVSVHHNTWWLQLLDASSNNFYVQPMIPGQSTCILCSGWLHITSILRRCDALIVHVYTYRPCQPAANEPKSAYTVWYNKTMGILTGIHVLCSSNNSRMQ